MKPELIRWRVALWGEKRKGLFKVRLNHAEMKATKSSSDQPRQKKPALMQTCTMSKKEKESYPPSVGRNTSSIDLGFESSSG